MALQFLKDLMFAVIFGLVIAIVLVGGLSLALANLPTGLLNPSGLGEWTIAAMLFLFPFLGLASLIGWRYNFCRRLAMLIVNEEQK